ncbi:MAG: AmmeMemoRadiSam system protein A [Candidatus Binatia bacterium]
MEEILIPPTSRKTLLSLARLALESFVRGEERKLDSDDPHLCSSDYGTFVSLHNHDELRGCIGTCFPERPLYLEVIEMTEAAASRDDRVPPITPGELSDIDIEISILSPLRLIQEPMSIEAGKDGIYVACDAHKSRAVLLPQVAARFGWDTEMFLSQTCLKAGLPKEAWKWPGIRISKFSALVFGEKE